jgi:hypothetical protein
MKRNFSTIVLFILLVLTIVGITQTEMKDTGAVTSMSVVKNASH